MVVRLQKHSAHKHKRISSKKKKKNEDVRVGKESTITLTVKEFTSGSGTLLHKVKAGSFVCFFPQ